MRSTADTGWDVTSRLDRPADALVYVGESLDDLSVYAAPGWGAWLAMWTLIAEWTNDPLAELARLSGR
jgi:hypothetical protein